MLLWQLMGLMELLLVIVVTYTDTNMSLDVLVHAERPGCRDQEAAGGGREEDHQRRTLVSGPAGAQGERVMNHLTPSRLSTLPAM